MEHFLYMPVNSYFFRGRANTAVLRCCINQYIRHFSAVTVGKDTRQVLTKPMTVSENQKKIYLGKNFSSYHQKNCILMDFDVWPYPKLPQIFRSIKNFFILKGMDGSFSFAEFSRNTVTALQVVTTLLSELRFSELEGLLTQECKEEVEKNLQCWPRDQVSILAIKPEKVIKFFPGDIVVFSDKVNDKVFVEIRVIHYVWLKYSSKFDNPDSEAKPLNRLLSHDIYARENLNKIYMCAVFNCKFIREFTKGVSDQWTISAINMKCYSNVIAV